MNPIRKFTIAGILLITAGSVWLFLFWYQSNTIMEWVSYAFLLLGWGFITYKVIRGNLIKTKNNVISNLTYWVSFGINIFLVSWLGDYRVSYILQHYPVKTTIATITGINQGPNSLRGPTPKYVTFKYTAQGRVIEEETAERPHYVPGYFFLIKYSVGNPEIFQVIKQVK